MKKIKYGVIGLGWFGEKHCEALVGIPNVELHSLCTRNPERLKEVGNAFGVQHLYTDFNRMLQDPELDAVSVVTMWDQHVAPAVAALDAGKHVFLEKPMASTVTDCDKIIAASKRARGSFMAGHICRFNPRYAAAKQEIEAGRIGKIVSMYARRNLPKVVGAQVLPKIGPIIGDGVHDTDLMLWYSGAKIISAYAQTINIRGYKNPDLGWTTFRFDTGAIGVLEDNWCMPDTTAFQIDERMEIVGTEGSIHIHETHPNYSICDKTGWHSPDTTYWPLIHGIRGGALREELAYFANCVAQDRKPSVITPEESREAVRACLAAEASAASGKLIEISHP